MNESKKRVNTSSKGKRSEKKTEEWLQARGFEVITCMKKAGYRKGNNDFFGKYDHIAVASKQALIDPKGSFPHYVAAGTTVFVQTKTNDLPRPDERKRLADFPAKYKYIFIWYDRVPEPRIIEL